MVLEWRPAERALTRAVVRALRELPDWELVFLRTKTLAGRPAIPASSVAARTCAPPGTAKPRAGILGEAAIFVPALEGLAARLARGRRRRCCDRLARQGSRSSRSSPRLRWPGWPRTSRCASALSQEARAQRRGQDLRGRRRRARGALCGALGRRRRRTRAPEPLADRDWILADLHLHTSWSHDCAVDAEDLLDHAEAKGLGAIAVTDHNVFGGALEAVELARGRDLIVIPGEEVKTDGQGEVIGLFLAEEIPRGQSFADTIAAIKAQGGLVYLPHPFDRLHSIPDAATLRRHLADIDVFEVYNARLLFEGYNDEALRFARKYNLTMGAGSDAHVPQGVATGGVRMRAFDGPEEFLLSLRIGRDPAPAEVARSTCSRLKWVAQVKERVR